MTEHPDVALPEAMVEAAARAWLAFFRDSEAHDEWDELQSWDQDNYREAARLGLVAALGVCTVRDHWGARIWRSDEPGYTQDAWADTRLGAETWVEFHSVRRAALGDMWLGNAQLLHYLSINTPAEPVDPTVEQP